MITEIGKDILGKYLIGTAPAYASYIAVGCGHRPITNLTYNITNISATSTVTTITVTGHEFIVGDKILVRLASTYASRNGTYTITTTTTNTVSFTFSGGTISSTATTGTASLDFSSKTSLDFEMFRVPVTSRGFIEENGQTKLVFSGEVPTTNRYEMTEVGIYSAASNPSAVGYDSRTIYAFTREESWKRNEQLIYTEDAPLDNGDISNDIHVSFLDESVIQTNATNKLFANLTRQQRSEQARYLNNMIMLSSNFSQLSGTTIGGISLSGKSKISLATGLDLSQNSPSDILKLAVSVVDVDSNAGVAPHRIRVIAEFTTSDASGSLRFNFESVAGALTTTRYQILSTTLNDGVVSGNFSWSKVNNVNFYASAVDSNGDILQGNSPTYYPTYYISLDALRLENVSSLNPLYGLTGYTAMRNSENGFARPIIKLSNTAAMIEFRLGVGIYNG